jgi:hypothetical protein
MEYLWDWKEQGEDQAEKKIGVEIEKEEDLGDSRTKRFGTTGVWRTAPNNWFCFLLIIIMINIFTQIN